MRTIVEDVLLARQPRGAAGFFRFAGHRRGGVLSVYSAASRVPAVLPLLLAFAFGLSAWLCFGAAGSWRASASWRSRRASLRLGGTLGDALGDQLHGLVHGQGGRLLAARQRGVDIAVLDVGAVAAGQHLHLAAVARDGRRAP